LPAGVLPACSIANDPDAFARAVCVRLDQSPAERRAIANRAALDSLTWEKRLARLPDLLLEATGRPAIARRRVSGT